MALWRMFDVEKMLGLCVPDDDDLHAEGYVSCGDKFMFVTTECDLRNIAILSNVRFKEK